MNIKQKIAYYERQRKLAQDLKLLAQQNLDIATRLESEADSALKELGVSEGRARKGKAKLSNEMTLELMARAIQ